MDLDRDKLLWMYQRMRQIREFENQLHTDFAAGIGAEFRAVCA